MAQKAISLSVDPAVLKRIDGKVRQIGTNRSQYLTNLAVKALDADDARAARKAERQRILAEAKKGKG